MKGAIRYRQIIPPYGNLLYDVYVRIMGEYTTRRPSVIVDPIIFLRMPDRQF